MTKTLILLRHAKSSWANPDLPDHSRPLNKRGQRGAKAIGKWLRGAGLVPDRALVSDARRTRETWEGLGLDAPLTLTPALYDATPRQILDVVIADGHGDVVLVIGHNPGIGVLAAEMAASPPEHPRFAQFPTAACLVLDLPCADWAEAAPGSGVVRAFVTPHDLT